jgi:hypothetical protein
VREAFAHEAVLRMDDGADVAAPGAAITVALCGHWAHSGPCPLSPHHTSAARIGGDVRVRTLFAAEPADEGRVRSLIDSALADSMLDAPNGAVVRWELASSGATAVRQSEAAHAARLVDGDGSTD